MASNAAMAFCSRVARATGFHPVGTAPTHLEHLVMECALPWDREVSESATFPAEVRSVLEHALEDGIAPRVTGLMPDAEYTRAGLTRVFYFTHTDEQSPTYDKQEYLVPAESLPAVVEALLYTPNDMQRFAEYRQATAHIRELLVCNHGSRDRCCATFGFEIYRELREAYVRSQPDTLRVWRCSHLGGHRMAPTLLDFPEGRYYAYVSADDLPNLIARAGTFSEMERQYRGWSRLSPLEQAAEHAVLLAEGWRWTTYRVQSEVAAGGGDDDAVTVRLSFSSVESAYTGSYEIVVREAPEQMLHFPSSCGKEVEPQPQYAVERVEKLQ